MVNNKILRLSPILTLLTLQIVSGQYDQQFNPPEGDQPLVRLDIPGAVDHFIGQPVRGLYNYVDNNYVEPAKHYLLRDRGPYVNQHFSFGQPQHGGGQFRFDLTGGDQSISFQGHNPLQYQYQAQPGGPYNQQQFQVQPDGQYNQQQYQVPPGGQYNQQQFGFHPPEVQGSNQWPGVDISAPISDFLEGVNSDASTTVNARNDYANSAANAAAGAYHQVGYDAGLEQQGGPYYQNGDHQAPSQYLEPPKNGDIHLQGLFGAHLKFSKLDADGKTGVRTEIVSPTPLPLLEKMAPGLFKQHTMSVHLIKK